MEENKDLNEEIIDEAEATTESTEEVNEAENNEETDLALVKKLKEENDKIEHRNNNLNFRDNATR